MASIWKREEDRGRRDRPYRISYTDESGKRRTVTGCTDLSATRQIANKLESDMQLRRRGIIDRAKERCAEQSRRVINEHIDEFIQHLKALGGKAPRYIQQVRSRLEAFVAFSHIEVLGSLEADRVSAFVLSLRDRGLSGVTVNEYIGTLRQFAKWAVATSRLPSDPLASITKQSAKTINAKRPRRAFTAEEIGALLHAARVRPAQELRTIRHGPRAGQQVARVGKEAITRAERLGEERTLAYLIAIWTGLRRSELSALQWQDVQLDKLPAQLTLRAYTTKAKRADRISLHPQVAEALRAYCPDKPKPSDSVLRTVPGMKVLRADLKLAGIPDVTEAGRVDLHAMRKSLSTYLSAHGVPLRLTQAHLRHTDPRLTAGAYTDETILPVAAMVTGLPWLPTDAESSTQTIRMTGTYDERAAHAQRAGDTHRHSTAKMCTDIKHEKVNPEPRKAFVDSELSNEVQEHSTKRVMGFEPTTFTLAT